MKHKERSRKQNLQETESDFIWKKEIIRQSGMAENDPMSKIPSAVDAEAQVSNRIVNNLPNRIHDPLKFTKLKDSTSNQVQQVTKS